MGNLPFLFSFLLFALMVSGKHETERNASATMIDGEKGRIGAIVDVSSRIGKEEILAMHMAIEDFNSLSNQNFSLVIRDSRNDPNLAALAAKDLISVQQVQALIGPQTWEMASVVAEVGNENQIPVLALANEIPKWATERFNFLVQASPSQLNQMRAIAGIVSSGDWHLVNVIYEDSEFSTTGVFPYLLVHALKDVGAEVSEFIGLSQFDSDLFSKEMEKLRRGSSRIFIVHMSFKLALHLFEKANEMGMMGKDYVWITTDSFTNLAHSFNVSINSVLQGVVGVKSYIPEKNPPYREFYLRFCQRFRLEHFDEHNNEPGIFAVQAYDAATTAALAMSEIQEKGNDLLDKIKLTDFQGLGGKIQFKDRKLAPADTFQIINVIGRSYRDLGFWSDKLGFSQDLRENSSSSLSMKELDNVFWPGGSLTTPRGWVVPTDSTPLRIGVPTNSMFKQYVRVEEDPTGNNLTFNGLAIDLFKAILDYLSMKELDNVFWPGGSLTTPRGWVVPTDSTPLRIGVPTNSMFKQYVRVEDPTGNNLTFNGLAIDLFKAILDYLPFAPHVFCPFNGTYNDLVKEIYLKKFDAAIGDIAITTKRVEHAEFTHPYSEAGLVMIVPTRKDTSNKALLFTKPFTGTMWILIAVVTAYNGFVVWFIERNHCPEQQGSIFDQAGAMLCSSFTTLFSLHGNRLHSNLSRMAMVAWLFMALVITQTYTANLASMLTVQKLEASISNIETLQKINASVGNGRGTFVERYLEEVLDFPAESIKSYTTPNDLVDALRNKEIAAAFLEVPFAKLFLARFCKEFMISGPTYLVGGFGFAFPRGYPLLRDVDKALLKVSECGKYRKLEESMIGNEKCEDRDVKDESSSLSPNSFFLLFVLSGGVSTIALTLYTINAHKSCLQQNAIWRLMLAVIKRWRNHNMGFSRRVSDMPQTELKNFPKATNLQIQV